MIQDDIQAFVQYWRDKYGSADLREWVNSVMDSMPDRIRSSVQKLNGSPLYPEPYFGYLSDDITNDILLLLLNPGNVGQDIKQVNAQIIERFRTWSKSDYTSEGDKIPPGSFEWRESRRNEACRIIDGAVQTNYRFLHTIEFFPFHSKRFDFLDSKSRTWISEWEATRLMVRAVRQISRESKVRLIFAIGIRWTTLLEDYGFKQQEFVTLGPKKNSHRIWRYQLPNEPASLPVIVYVSGAGRMGLPTSIEAVSVIRKMIST